MDPAYFIAMSYGAAAIAFVAEIVLLRVRRARALQRIDAERDLEATE